MIHDEIGARAINTQASMASINLDAAASTRPAKPVIDAIVKALESDAGNPSSAHQFGALGREILTRARDSVLRLIEGAVDDGVIFTSGCTEANNTVIRSASQSRVITSAVEHPSILRAAERAAATGVDVRVIGVDANGLIDLDALGDAIEASEKPPLVSIQMANSETGVVQPVAAIADMLAKHPNATFHCDAAQAFGKIPVNMARGVGPDIVTLSGHKLHSPMGIGAIVLADRDVTLSPFILGGDQEHGLRAGTEAISLVAGLGAACDLRSKQLESDVRHLASLRDRLEAGLRENCGEMIVQGADGSRLPNISSVRFPGIDSMSLIAQLDGYGVAASQGSACSSQRPEPSHVLTAMGLSETEAFEAVRFSVSVLNNAREIDLAVQIISDVVHQVRRNSWLLR